MPEGTNRLGLGRGRVRLLPADPDWPRLFELEAERIGQAVSRAGLSPLVLEHCGSTAIPHLLAKPVIDLMGGYSPPSRVEAYVQVCCALGYEARGPQGVPERELLVLGAGSARTHHLSVVQIGEALWRDHLLFRDRLREDPVLAERYAVLKQRLARQYAEDRGGYTSGKSEFVRRVPSEALEQRRLTAG